MRDRYITWGASLLRLVDASTQGNDRSVLRWHDFETPGARVQGAAMASAASPLRLPWNAMSCGIC